MVTKFRFVEAKIADVFRRANNGFVSKGARGEVPLYGIENC
jgi:hypothetical protein